MFSLNGLNLTFIMDGFVNSDNEEKQKFIDYIALASEDEIKEKAIVTACHNSWGVNGDRTFDVLAFRYLEECEAKVRFEDELD